MKLRLRLAGTVPLLFFCGASVAGGAALAAATDIGRHRQERQPIAPAAQPAAAHPGEMRRTHAEPEPEPAPTVSPEVPPDLDHATGRRFRDGAVITGTTAHRLVLFTFDDGPDAHHTPRLLDLLDASGVRAVFFLTVSRIRGDTRRQREQQEIAREIVRRGHMVGSHTLDHIELPTLDRAAVLYQVLEAERIMERVIGQRPWLMRVPGGGRSARIDALLAEHNYTQMLWNLGTGDTQVRTPEEVARIWQRVFERREREQGERGGIVLLHDIHPWSVEAFPRIVDDLRRRNCRLLARGEELYDIVDGPAFFFAARGDDPAASAPPATAPASELAQRQRRLVEEARQRCPLAH